MLESKDAAGTALQCAIYYASSKVQWLDTDM